MIRRSGHETNHRTILPSAAGDLSPRRDDSMGARRRRDLVSHILDHPGGGEMMPTLEWIQYGVRLAIWFASWWIHIILVAAVVRTQVQKIEYF